MHNSRSRPPRPGAGNPRYDDFGTVIGKQNRTRLKRYDRWPAVAGTGAGTVSVHVTSFSFG